MAKTLVLGLFHEASPTADTLDQLRGLGIADDEITVLSSIPYRAEILGRPRPKGRVGAYAGAGAILGLATGLFLSVGIFLLYPIEQGGQPIVPIPPTLIILFEVTMLGTMWAAFLGLLRANRFPITKSQLYDPRITEGHLGVLVEVGDAYADQVESILRTNGAHHLKRAEAATPPDFRHRAFWATIIGAVVVGAILVTLVAYNVIDLSFPTNMADQASIASQQGPRLAAPAQAVPIQGPVSIDDQPATEPLASTPDSIARGKTLFDIHCALCHGQDAKGDGKLSGFFNPKPKDLTSAAVQELSDQEIYMVITNGFGPMPSLAENLSRTERWDVINYIRTLKGK
jgi:mono/diheme cytochrome c family protein